jgi:hypothetical protein
MDYKTVTILHFFGPTAFFAAEGSSFFCKSFVSCGPRGLSSLIGKDLVITFKVSPTSAAEGVEGVSSSFSDWMFSFSELLRPLLPS